MMSHPVFEQSELVLCSSRMWKRAERLVDCEAYLQSSGNTKTSFLLPAHSRWQECVINLVLTKTLLIVIRGAQVLQIRWLYLWRILLMYSTSIFQLALLRFDLQLSAPLCEGKQQTDVSSSINAEGGFLKPLEGNRPSRLWHACYGKR